ncbi:hypothetical protein BHG07_18135 [Brenneria salicis ATCC 15712 = DSM 30166]|nr:hypothetical protein BHG07_18135 [Brenneria salicis ATCC 15712 = DSM 30166]
MGCAFFTDPLVDHREKGTAIKGGGVVVLNVRGGGDAFMSGLLRGFLGGEGGGKACSSAKAIEWDESFKKMDDPSGRAVGVHQSAYQ